MKTQTSTLSLEVFTREAIENGYTNSQCEGWDWIREHLNELDYIFQEKEYIACEGMLFTIDKKLFYKEVLK